MLSKQLFLVTFTFFTVYAVLQYSVDPGEKNYIF